MPPAVVIKPQTRPRRSGAPRPESLPSSDSASAKPIEMPAPIEAASPTRKAFHELWVAKRRGEHRRERRHRTVHQADKAGLDDLQDKPPALVLRFVVRRASPVSTSCSRPVASWSCLSSASARSPESLRIDASVVRVTA